MKRILDVVPSPLGFLLTIFNLGNNLLGLFFEGSSKLGSFSVVLTRLEVPLFPDEVVADGDLGTLIIELLRLVLVED